MKLHYRTYGSGQPLIILHGLFGSSDNWQTLGKKIAEDYQVFLVDQRNHGHSPHDEEFTYSHMAADLQEFIEDHYLDDVILVGHSMGGKTVMTYALMDESRISKMVVVDIGPKQYPMHHQTILEGLHTLDLSVDNTRRKADEKLQQYIPEVGVRQFLLKNLYWVENESGDRQLGWRINIPVISREMENIIGGLDSEQIITDTLFIRGERSNYILEDDYDSILMQFPNAIIRTFDGVGHWVHAEAPQQFYSTLMEFLRD